MNFPTPKNDKIKVTIRQKMNDTNTKVVSSEVVKIDSYLKLMKNNTITNEHIIHTLEILSI